MLEILTLPWLRIGSHMVMGVLSAVLMPTKRIFSRDNLDMNSVVFATISGLSHIA